jgi:ABC-type transport system substrate-binding protein
MRRIAFLRVAAASLTAPALGQRPRYGGTLIVETRARGGAQDLRRLGSAVFEGLVGRDEMGAVCPQLATNWSYDTQKKQWRFALRPNVKAHDGTAITPALIAGALSRWLSPRVVSASADSLTIQGEPALIEDIGWKTATGPFKVAEWIPGQRGVLVANEAHWRGRPYLNAIEVRMGRSLRDQLFDFEGGRADIVELSVADSRRGFAVWHSAPLDLVALAFVRSRPGVQEERVRRAVALSIDRAPIVQVLLQRLGEATASFVPQRVSGYGFLFDSDRDLERATQMAKPAPPPLVLGYDAAEPSLRLIAERIALNARDAGIILKPSSSAADEPDLVLTRVSATATEPGAALAEYGRGLQMPLPVYGRSREEVLRAERTALVGGWVVPLFHVPAIYAVRPRVRNWVKPGSVWWRLDETWLEG